MLLDPIRKEDIVSAALQIDKDGVPTGNRWAEYWIVIDKSEYQFKHLIRTAYFIATGKGIAEESFTSSPFTRGYIQKTFGYKIYFKVPDNITFFEASDIEFFAKKAGARYKADVRLDVKAGERIKSSIFSKSNVWVRLINNPEYETIQDNRWQLSGYFKPYSWARIFKPKLKSAKVFFTFGVSSKNKSLVFKLDCQRKAYQKEKALFKNQIKQFDRIVNGTGAEWNEIPLSELKIYNWEKLQRVTLDFIELYDTLYSEVTEAILSTNGKGNTVKGEALKEVQPPAEAFNNIPEKAYTFKGVTIDYDSNNKRFSEIGSAGEELVITREKLALTEQGRTDLANRVEKVEDGLGYDIRSFEKNGQEKCIEVKTTTGPVLRPFFMSDNEWAFMKHNSKNYYLYRVFDFDPLLNKGKYFQMKGDIETRVFWPSKQIEIFIKSN